MSSYGARVAALYDLFYRDKPYGEEARFIDEVVRKFGDGAVRRLLDVAGGTASHSLELAKLGYEITCADQSEGMLERAREKCARADVDVRLVHQDMRTLGIDGAAFDAVTCLFDSIGYVIADDGLDAAVRAIRAHLKRNGLFIVEYWHAPAMLRSYDPVRVRRWQTEQGEVLRISETSLNPAEHSATVKYSIYELNSDGRYRFTEEAHSNRYFHVDEIEALLTNNGFEVIGNYSGYDWNDPVSDSTWHIVTVARNVRSR